MLKKCGFLKHIKRGQWEVTKHIPHWFDLGHAAILLGYYQYRKNEEGNYVSIKTYKGMDRIAILAQIDHDTHHPTGVKQIKQEKNLLPALRTPNQLVYREVVNRIRRSGITSFNTQNQLAALIETFKFPHLDNDGKKPKYSVKGNYEPIINHLVHNKILSVGRNGKYRIGFTVLQNDSNAPVAQSQALESTAVIASEKISKIVENYSKVLNKIDNQNGSRVVDNSKTMDNSQNNIKLDEVTELTKNIAFLEAAFDAITNCSSNDANMRARLYHLQVQIQDLTTAFDDKRTFILNTYF
jgi:hypothetical protein